MIRQIKLQWRDRDISVAKRGHVGVIIRRCRGKNAAVPEIVAPARVLPAFIGVRPGPRALPDDFYPGGDSLGFRLGMLTVATCPG